MKTGAKTPEKPPSPSDLEGWRRAAADKPAGRVPARTHRRRDTAHRPNGDRRLVADLINHVSDELLRRIIRLVGKNHRNQGDDIIWRAHHQLIVAVLKPNSKDGQALCKSFRKCVEFRVADAIRAERKYAHRNQPSRRSPASPMMARTWSKPSSRPRKQRTGGRDSTIAEQNS